MTSANDVKIMPNTVVPSKEPIGGGGLELFRLFLEVRNPLMPM